MQTNSKPADYRLEYRNMISTYQMSVERLERPPPRSIRVRFPHRVRSKDLKSWFSQLDSQH